MNGNQPDKDNMNKPVTKYHEKYVKVRFTSKHRGSTAGLVFTQDQLANMSIQQFSLHWPVSEGLKMERIQRSPQYATWEEAFNHQFDS